MIVGYVLFGAATLQAGVLPRWCGLALLLGWPVAYLLGDYGGILLGLMYVALGHVLWSLRGVSTEQPAPLALGELLRTPCLRTSEKTPSRDCLESSWKGRIACFLVARSAKRVPFRP